MQAAAATHLRWGFSRRQSRHPQQEVPNVLVTYAVVREPAAVLEQPATKDQTLLVCWDAAPLVTLALDVFYAFVWLDYKVVPCTSVVPHIDLRAQ